MKHLILFAFTTIFLIKSAYSQQMTYQELIGTWDKTDSSKGKISFKFLDTSNLLVEGSMTTNKLSYKLIKDKSKASPVILLELDKNGIKQQTFYTIERVKVGTIKLAALYPYDQSVQKVRSNINQEAFYLVRRVWYLQDEL